MFADFFGVTTTIHANGMQLPALQQHTALQPPDVIGIQSQSSLCQSARMQRMQTRTYIHTTCESQPLTLSACRCVARNVRSVNLIRTCSARTSSCVVHPHKPLPPPLRRHRRRCGRRLCAPLKHLCVALAQTQTCCTIRHQHASWKLWN